MASPTDDVSLDGGDHLVHFYEQDVELVDAVVDFAAAGFAAAGIAIVIATEAHREAALPLHQVRSPPSSVFHGANEDAHGSEAPLARRLVAEFAAERASPGHARRLVLGVLVEWGCDRALLRDAAVVVSELATNAVLHAASSFSLSVTLDGARLRIAVHDARPLSATAGDGGLSPQRTHGLGLVEALSLRWGAEDAAQGKAVWAELRLQ